MNRSEFIKKYKEKIYIGDSVYVHFDGFHIVLETRNGLPSDPSNVIMLDPEVILELFEYRQQLLGAMVSIQEDAT